MRISNTTKAEFDNLRQSGIVPPLTEQLKKYLKGENAKKHWIFVNLNGPNASKDINCLGDCELECRLLAIELGAACFDLVAGNAVRDNARALHKSIDDLRQITRLSEELRTALRGCDEAVLNQLTGIGPIYIDFYRHDCDIFAAARAEHLPKSVVGFDRDVAQPGWDKDLQHLGRLAALALESVQRESGAVDGQSASVRGRRSVHSLYTPHPSWTFVQRLAKILSERVGHIIGRDRADSALLKGFVSEVLNWMFPRDFFDLSETYVEPFLKCIRAIDRLREQKDDLRRAIELSKEICGTPDADLVAELKYVELRISEKKQLLNEGPTRRNRKQQK